MNHTHEEKILNDIIAVNLDACSFYREAADKVVVPQAEMVFHDLERLHTGIVADLGMAVYSIGNPAPDYEPDVPALFKPLNPSTPIDVDCGLINAVENAENRCIDILTQAINSEEVSIDIKMRVLEAATMLHGRHEYIQKLRGLASIMERDFGTLN